MTGELHPFQVGSLACISICDNPQTVDAERPRRIFARVAPDELEQAIAASGGHVANSINILIIRAAGQTVIVDTGVGGENSQLLDSLRNAGVDPETIDRVIITHGHGDHIGGIVRADGTLVFPNARYSISRPEWDFWQAELAASDDPNHVARRNLLPIQDRVDFMEPDAEVVPGVRAVPVPGHTIGQTGLLLESDGERLLHIADTLHHPAQLAHPDWQPIFDRQPDLAVQTRRAIIERAVRERLRILAYHLPFPGIGHMVRQDGTARWEPSA